MQLFKVYEGAVPVLIPFVNTFVEGVPGLLPGLGIISGLSLLVLFSAPRAFFSGYSGFPLS